MPRLGSIDTEQHKVGNFTYSAAKIDDLGQIASEFTLVCIVNDVSGSVVPYKDEMEQTLKAIAEACAYSPRKDFLLIRHIQFDTQVNETHGFVNLDSRKPDDYIGCLQPGGMTALYDAARNAIVATGDYGQKLMKQRFMTNAIVIIMTDACDNASACDINDVRKAVEKARKDECLESLLVILVGVGYGNDKYSHDQLDNFHKEAKFDQFVAISDANAKTLAKLAQFVSKSISSQSQSLGSGGSSKPLTF